MLVSTGRFYPLSIIWTLGTYIIILFNFIFILINLQPLIIAQRIPTAKRFFRYQDIAPVVLDTLNLTNMIYKSLQRKKK